MLSNTDPFGEQLYVDSNTTVVYIIRYPADVLESYYHYLKHQWNCDLGTFSEFIRTEQYGINAWTDHVESWEGNWDHLVRFEDLKADPTQYLTEIAALFDHEFTPETVASAVKKSSFENMAVIEEKYGLPEKHGANMDYSFMRKGTTDRGEEYFHTEDYRYLATQADELLARYEYDLPALRKS